MKFIGLIAIFFLLASACGEKTDGIQTRAQLASVPTGGSKAPWLITADQMEVDDTIHTAVFYGDVHFTQTGLQFEADKITIFYLPNSSGRDQKSNNRVSQVKAEGNVRFKQTEYRGTAEEMVFDVVLHTITLTGNKTKATIVKEADITAGQKIILTLDDKHTDIKKITVHQGKNFRASVRISPATIQTIKEKN